MAKASLLKAACAAAMLVATPVLAQTTPAPANTSPAGAPNTPTTHEATPGAHAMHHSAMVNHHAKHASQSATSQDAAVDRLNQQSYEAAQKGQAFGPTETTTPSSGSTTDGGGKM